MSTKVLMVCLGNICRSPLAQGILESKVAKNKLDIQVDSAGTGHWHVGQKPDDRSVFTGKLNGIDISKQKARQFTVTDFEDFDYIYVMDRSNYENVLLLAPNEDAKLKVNLILNELEPNANLEVPDPYYGGATGFNTVYRMLDQACDKIIHKIKNAE